MRWLAVAAQQEDGYMSDYDTFPLNIRVEDGLDLPNSGSFTGYNGHVPSLMSASAPEWDRVAKAVLDKAVHKFEIEKFTRYSDMLALRDSLKEDNAFIPENKVVAYPYTEMGKMNCRDANKALAAHLSHMRTQRARENEMIPKSRGRHEYGLMVVNDWKNQCS